MSTKDLQSSAGDKYWNRKQSCDLRWEKGMERGNRTIDEESLKRQSSHRQLSLPFQPEPQKSRDQEEHQRSGGPAFVSWVRHTGPQAGGLDTRHGFSHSLGPAV